MSKDKQELSINDLKGMNGNNELKEVNPFDIKPVQQKEPEKVEVISDAYSAMFGAVDRIREEAKEFNKQREEYEEKLEIEKEINDEEEEMDKEIEEVEEEVVENTPDLNKNIKIASEDDLIDDEEDLDINEEIDADLDEDDREARFESMKKEIKKTIKPISNKIDISTFKISKKNMTLTSALKAVNNNKTIIDWGLFNKEEVIALTEFSGNEIQLLNPANSNLNLINTYINIFNIIYSHIENANKPSTMEEWVKGIPFVDMDHLYMAIYKASYHNANYIPYECEHCKKVFVSKDVKIEDMVKYKNKEVEEKCKEILEGEAICKPNEIDIELTQISDDYIVGLRTPSIYNIIFESAVLDTKFTEKYSSFLTIAAYIDSIYYIDRENNELREIEIEKFPGNLKKTIKNRIIKLSKVINKLNSDQLALLETMVEERDNMVDDITYVIPECTCPECGKKIKELETTASRMLFTRHQLTTIANTSKN